MAALLEELSDLAPRVFKRLDVLLDSSLEPVCLDRNHDAATGTSYVRVGLQVSDPLAKLMPALRALKRQLVIIDRAA